MIKDTFLYNQHRIVHQVIYSTSSNVSARQDVDQGFVLARNMVFPVLVLARTVEGTVRILWYEISFIFMFSITYLFQVVKIEDSTVDGKETGGD